MHQWRFQVQMQELLLRQDPSYYNYNFDYDHLDDYDFHNNNNDFDYDYNNARRLLHGP